MNLSTIPPQWNTMSVNAPRYRLITLMSASGRVRSGMLARVTVDSPPGRSFAGKVVRVAPFVLDRLEENRTVEIEVEHQLEHGAGSGRAQPRSKACLERPMNPIQATSDAKGILSLKIAEP